MAVEMMPFHRCGRGMALVVLEAENPALEPDADRRCRQADAAGRRHRVEHVGNQFMERRRREIGHRARDFEQLRIAHAQNASHSHRCMLFVMIVSKSSESGPADALPRRHAQTDCRRRHDVLTGSGHPRQP